MDPLIRCSRLQKSYRKGTTSIEVLHDVSAELYPGDFVVLLGPSGSGKTTLLFMLGLLQRPDGGLLELFGRQVRAMYDRKMALLRNQELGFVFQRFNLFPRLKALDNVMWPMRAAHTPAQQRLERARMLLERVGLSHRMDHYPHQLSAGEEQRVAVARALADDPQLIVADEPTGNPGGAAKDAVMELLAAAHAEGKSVLLATHDTGLTRYATRVWEIRDGRLIDQLGAAG